MMFRNALISDCGKYRYWLTRSWDVERGLAPSQPLPTCGFVMLNPSTADASIDDPTIRKCIGFAQRLGFGSIVVVNLYAYRATAPGDLRKAVKRGESLHGVSPTVFAHYEEKLRGCERVICAWGANARGFDEPWLMMHLLRRMLHEPVALRLLADGTPEHPLMIPYNVTDLPLPVLP